MCFDNIDWSLILPSITLIVSIVCPVIVTILNNRNNKQIKRLELKYQKSTLYFKNQQLIFDNYVLYASKQLITNYASEYIEYMRYYGEIFMYVPSCYWNELEALNAYIQNRDKESATQARDQFIKVTKILGEVLQESDRKFPKL